MLRELRLGCQKELSKRRVILSEKHDSAEINLQYARTNQRLKNRLYFGLYAQNGHDFVFLLPTAGSQKIRFYLTYTAI
jgi:hypothetical protein